jgi:hypothetical protein
MRMSHNLQHFLSSTLRYCLVSDNEPPRRFATLLLKTASPETLKEQF